MSRLSPAQLAQWLGDPRRESPLLLDVREEWEFEHVSLPESQHVPLAELPAMRSLRAVHFLAHHGFAEVHDLAGGIDAWAVQQDPTMARY